MTVNINKGKALDTLNMTPMIDVVFNLLIFFLLGSAYANDKRRVDLELPTVKAAMPLVDTPEEITINILANGQLNASGRNVTRNNRHCFRRQKLILAQPEAAPHGQANRGLAFVGLVVGRRRGVGTSEAVYFSTIDGG